MRKTTIQVLLLIIAGTIIFWREWSSNFLLGQQLEGRVEQVIPSFRMDTSPNTIIWLVLLAGGLWIIAELAIRYLKLSSPNSV